LSLPRRDWDTIVVGLGGIGSGALYWLARELRGDVLGLEQFDLGHDRGASQDWSRIIRYSYHRPHYVRLARQAYETWRVVEEESGESLVATVGGLDLFPEGCAIPLEDYTSSLDAEGVPYELIGAREIAHRWPAFRLEPGVRGLFQAEGGLVRAALANAAHARLAREYGAEIRERHEVEALRSARGEIDVLAGGKRYRCGKLVIAGGAWSNELLSHLGVELPLTVTQEQVVYWQPVDPEPLREGRFPIWIWMDDPSFYGFPYLDGPGLKVGQDVGGSEVTARTRTFEPDVDALERTRAFVERVIPGGAGEVRSIKTCLYTLTPDRDFVIDGARSEGGEGCFVAIGAGHAFKFASAIGRILADLAQRGSAREGVDLEPFRIDRPVLQEKDPKRSFLV
jgi:sarcosine oxidase